MLLALGLTSTVFAAVAGSLVWAWAPQIGNWTLSPQQEVADAGKIAGRDGHAWVPPEMPPINPWNTARTLDLDTPAGPGEGEKPLQVASVEVAGDSHGGHGPLDFENKSGPNPDPLVGLFSSPTGTGASMGGGQGGSWPGTLNQNNGSRSFRGGPSSLTSGSTGGNPPGNPTCDSGKVWNGSACVVPETPPEEKTPGKTAGLTPDPEEGGPQSCTDGKVWDAQSETCVVDTTTPGTGMGGQTGTGPGTGPQSCSTGQIWDAQSETCVTQTTGPGTGPQSCGEGSIWDEQTQTCIAANVPDPEICPTETPCQIVEDEPCTGPSCGTDPNLILVPEPGAMAMFLMGLLGLGWMIRRRA